MDSVLGVTEKYQYIYYGHRTRSPHRYRVVELNLQQSEPTISLNAFLKYCHINTVSLFNNDSHYAYKHHKYACSV